MLSLVKNHTIGAERREGVELELTSRSLELLAEILQIGLRGVGEELEEIVVESLSPRPVDDNIGDGEHLEKEPHAFVLVACRA